MNKVICDECQAQITPTIESKHLTGSIRINYFRCNSCKEKYLIDVTDQSTREKQIKYANLSKEIQELYKSAKERPLVQLEAISKILNKQAEQLLKEIKEAKAELKAKYEGEL